MCAYPPAPGFPDLGAPLLGLHMSLGLRLSFVLSQVSLFKQLFLLVVPLSSSWLQKRLSPSAPRPPAFLVQSLCFTIDSGQLEKGGGQGLGLAQFRLRRLGRWILPSGIVWRGTSHPKGGFVSVASLNPGLEASQGMQGAAW